MVLKAEKRIRLNCAENRWGQWKPWRWNHPRKRESQPKREIEVWDLADITLTKGKSKGRSLKVYGTWARHNFWGEGDDGK